jgi:hypothetical protein
MRFSGLLFVGCQCADRVGVAATCASCAGRAVVCSAWAFGLGQPCPITQTAFVRILSNPTFSPNVLTPRNALHLLENNLKHPKHEYWSDDVTLCEAVAKMDSRLTGHQQITDAYLLGLAIHKKGRLATLDRSIRGLLASEINPQNYIEFIG